MKKIEVVAAVICNGKTILATQRGYGAFKGGWEFPGGKVEMGETGEEAIIREIHEELAIDIEVDKFLCTVEYEYPEFYLTMHTYLCHVKKGKMQLVEHQAAKWLSQEELDSVEWLPADVEVVKELKSMMGSNQ